MNLSVSEDAIMQNHILTSNHGEVDTFSTGMDGILPSLILALFALIVPFFLGSWKVIQPKVQSLYLVRHHPKEVVRTITGTFRHTKGDISREKKYSDHSGVLLNAVLLRIVAEMERNPELAQDEMWLDKPSVLFLFDPLKSDSCFTVGAKTFELIDNYNDDVAKRIAQLQNRLHAFKVLRLPTAGTWIPLGDDIDVTYQRQIFSEASARAVKHILHLRTTGEDGLMRLEDFVQKSLQGYTTWIPRIAGNHRYYFQVHISDGDTEGIRFKRNPILPTRTFDRLFFPQKNAILGLVDNFLERRGRFSVGGFPRKLGFFLYGPPGTGKTSFVAALATYTNRHVISVHLPYITKNEELQSIFLRRELVCCDKLGAFRFDFEDVIFLLDDVHPTEDLVRKRVSPKKNDKKSVSSSLGPSLPVSLSPLLQLLNSDAANLSGFLNVLDGVVDTPGRIIAMTAEKSEGIDPALLRAGRFGHRIHMEYMRVEELIELLGLHFGEESQLLEDNQTSQSIYSTNSLSIFKGTNIQRKLSEMSIQEVRHCVSSVEARIGREFSICPSEAESMCLTSATLHNFLEKLSLRQDVPGQ